MEDLDSELEERSPLPATLDRVKSLQENNISSHNGSPTSPFGGESGRSHRGAPIRPGDTIRLSVNGRAVNSRSTCLISRAVICKYLVYFAVVVVYVPMVVKIFSSLATGMSRCRYRLPLGPLWDRAPASSTRPTRVVELMSSCLLFCYHAVAAVVGTPIFP